VGNLSIFSFGVLSIQSQLVCPSIGVDLTDLVNRVFL